MKKLEAHEIIFLLESLKTNLNNDFERMCDKLEKHGHLVNGWTDDDGNVIRATLRIESDIDLSKDEE